MTPIKDIIRSGAVVATRDHSDQLGPLILTASPEDATWVAWSLGRAHGVDVVEVPLLPGAPDSADLVAAFDRYATAVGWDIETNWRGSVDDEGQQSYDLYVSPAVVEAEADDAG